MCRRCVFKFIRANGNMNRSNLHTPQAYDITYQYNRSIKFMNKINL